MSRVYMSRVRLNTDRRITQLALAAPGKLHGAVEQAFKVRQSRTLWRIDRLGGKTYLMIISEDLPDLSGITQQFGFENETGESRDYGRFLSRVQNQSIWRFRLVANPTYCHKEEFGRGSVAAHVSEKYQMAWLLKVAENNGFSILPDTAQIVSSTWRSFFRKNSHNPVRFREVTYEGVLQVQDENILRDAMIKGVGREKAYGMGMITLVKP